MNSKNKTIGKIAVGIFVVGATFFGLLASSITPPQLETANEVNSKYTLPLDNEQANTNDSAINILKSKGKIIQTSISAYTSSALVLDDRGKPHLYMWGNNSSSQQGHGSPEKMGYYVKTPTKVQFFEPLIKKGATITQISMSNWTSSALVRDDKGKNHLYMWGWNGEGQQGDGKDKAINTPKEVNFDNNVKNITQISMSRYTSSALVLDDRGKTHLYMWGYNNMGQQGDEGKHKEEVKIPKEVNTLKEVKTPKEVKFFDTLIKNGATIIQTSISAYTSSALVLDNRAKPHLYMWGANDCAQQGNGHETNANVTTPKEVIFPDNNLTITQISMSEETSSALVLDDKGKTHFYMWGDNILNQQGDGKTDDVKTPTKVKFFEPLIKKGATITQISIASFTSSALVRYLDQTTHLYMWGANIMDQQGDGKTENVKTPKEVSLSKNLTITQISISGNTSSALVQDKNGKTHLYMWGANNLYQQGDRKTENVKTPKEILGLPNTHRNYVWIYCVFIGIPVFALILFGILFGIYKFKNPSKNKNKPLPK